MSETEQTADAVAEEEAAAEETVAVAEAVEVEPAQDEPAAEAEPSSRPGRGRGRRARRRGRGRGRRAEADPGARWPLPPARPGSCCASAATAPSPSGATPTVCHARPTRSGPECGRQLYPIGELPEQVQKALNPLKASKKASKG